MLKPIMTSTFVHSRGQCTVSVHWLHSTHADREADMALWSGTWPTDVELAVFLMYGLQWDGQTRHYRLVDRTVVGRWSVRDVPHVVQSLDTQPVNRAGKRIAVEIMDG